MQAMLRNLGLTLLLWHRQVRFPRWTNPPWKKPTA